MSNEEQLQYPTTLESFKKERERYRPKDLIDFSIEYFKALQNGTPLKYKDLSGLDKFILDPEYEEIVRRLGIPDEDLYRVLNRRKHLTQKDILSKFNDELLLFNQIIDSSSNNKLSEQEMNNYLQFKKDTFRDTEFIRFIDGLENVSLDNDRRIYFTKFFNLNSDEKKAIIDLLSCDIKIIKNIKINDWKEYLIKMDKSSKHTYASYDNISYKLEEKCKKLDNGEDIDFNQAEELYNNYFIILENMFELDEKEIYKILISKYQFQRIILYYMAKIHSKKDENFKDLFEKVEKIFNKSFAYLTNLDYYDFILSCFIPLLKYSDKTSQEHREMESFLNKLMPQIPYIYNINFEEEKSLYYNIECVKYFLNKESRIKDLSFKKILIELINIFAKKVNDIKNELNIEHPLEIRTIFHDKLQLLTLQLNEFYPHLIEFTNKLISIAIKYNVNNENPQLKESMISEFKYYPHIDQILITNSMKMIKMFEADEVKQKGINDVIEILVKSLSIQEMNEAIKYNKIKEDEIIKPIVKDYYKKLINTPRYDFNILKCLKFKDQNQIVSLIIKNNRNLENTALFYEKDNIQPFLDINFMIEEIFNFQNLYFKLIFDKNMDGLLKNDFEIIKNKFKNNFKKENEFVESLPENIENNKEIIDTFNEFNSYQQKLILTFLNFSDNIACENKNMNKIKILSINYLTPKIDFITKKILQENDIKSNIIFFESIYDDLRHVNYPIYIYIKYDKDINIFISFSKEEQQLIQKIEQALLLNPKYEIPKSLSFKEILECNETQKIMEDLSINHKLINEYIKLYNPQDLDSMLTDFTIFNPDERKIIIKVLEKKEGNISNLKDYDHKNDDKNKFTLKKVVIAETDSKLIDSNEEFGNDIKVYYRIKLLHTEKKLSSSKKSFISSVLDFPYDPNNNYISQSFLSFGSNDKITIVEDILCRNKITNFQTFYYDIIASNIMEELLNKYIDIAKRHQDNEIFMNKIKDEFIFLVNFFDHSVLKFILELNTIENQTIYQFTNNFTDKERKLICIFLELYSIITRNNRYNDFKDELINYLEDLTYTERLEDINKKLDMILNNEIIKYMFIITAEEIKETTFEIDYIIEEICSNNEESLTPLVKNLFETINLQEREILIKSLKCIKEQNNSGYIENYIKELEDMKDAPEQSSIFNNISDSFEAIKRVLSECKDKSDIIGSFQKLKNTLNLICSDLFKFVENCKRGFISIRKIKAIAPIKVEIIKILLDIENMFSKNDNLIRAIDLLRELKIN